jgi:UDP-N-acetylmuramoyl-tripeptide--D-alanyl-D-alanine ligase
MQLKSFDELKSKILTLGSVSTDSREIKTGDIFVPLVGEKFDGHDFIFDTLDKGAAYALSEKPFSELKTSKSCNPEQAEGYPDRIIQVDSTLDAYQELARTYKRSIHPLTIAISGSSGKTTTKELLRLVLEDRFKVHYSEANFNNEIGVPKTILAMPRDTEVLILEMGMRGLGQIELLSRIAEPNIAIITNIGTAHIELLQSKANIEKAKLEIIAAIKPYSLNKSSNPIKNKLEKDIESSLIIDSDLHKKLEQENKLNQLKVDGVLKFSDEGQFTAAGLLSRGLIADMNAVTLVAKMLGLKDSQIQAGFHKYNPGRGRGSFHKDAQGNLWIDDTYNANPDSIRNNVDALLKQFIKEPKIIVIGDIKESREDLVDKVFLELNALCSEHYTKLIDARNKSTEDIVRDIKAKLTPSGNNVIYLKASRAAGLEKVLESFI